MKGRNSTHRYLLAALALAAAPLLAASTAADAQDWTLRRAASLEAEARSLEQERDDWKRAAWYYRAGAATRPAGDPEAVTDLLAAGRLSWYVGDREQALTDLEGAAARARQGGDVYTVGQLLVDAAWVAQKLGRTSDARVLVSQARDVVQAVVLSQEVRDAVLRRIGAAGAGNVVAVAPDWDQADQPGF